jgi:hypothetical protein
MEKKINTKLHNIKITDRQDHWWIFKRKRWTNTFTIHSTHTKYSSQKFHIIINHIIKLDRNFKQSANYNKNVITVIKDKIISAINTITSILPWTISHLFIKNILNTVLLIFTYACHYIPNQRLYLTLFSLHNHAINQNANDFHHTFLLNQTLINLIFTDTNKKNSLQISWQNFKPNFFKQLLKNHVGISQDNKYFTIRSTDIINISSLPIIHYNIRYFLSNQLELLRMIKEHQPNVISLNQLGSSIDINIIQKFLSAYQVIRREGTNWNSDALLPVDQWIRCIPVNINKFNIAAETVSLNNLTYIISTIYLLSNTLLSLKTISQLLRYASDTILISDFNAKYIDWESSTNNSKDDQL